MATSRAWAWLSGRGVRHPRRRQGARARHAGPPALAATGGRARGRRRRSGARERARLGARPALMATSGTWLMALPDACWPCWGWACSPSWLQPTVTTVWLAARRGVLVGARRAARASRPRVAEPRAGEPTQVRLGRAGPRRCAGHQHRRRDACAACCATPGRRRPGRWRAGTRLDVPPGERVAPHDPPDAHPARRPARRPGDRAQRAGRSGWPRASARSRSPGTSGRCRRSPRASTCPAGLPSCASSTGGRRCGSAGPGHRVRQPARLRRRRRRAQHRLAGDRPPPAPRRAHLAARAHRRRDPGPRHLAHLRRAGRRHAPRLDAAMDAALLLTALACHAGDRVQVLAGDREVRARLGGPTRTTCCTTSSTRWRPWSRRCSRPTGRCWPPRSAGLGRRRALVVLLTSLERAAIEEGLLPVLAALDRPPPGRRRVGHRPRPVRDGWGRTTTREVYDAAAAERTVAPAPAHGSGAATARGRRHRRRARRAAGAARRPLPDAQAPGPALVARAQPSLTSGRFGRQIGQKPARGEQGSHGRQVRQISRRPGPDRRRRALTRRRSRRVGTPSDRP